MARLATLLALALAWLPLLARGLYFYLDAGAERCFIEELPQDTIVVGTSASSPTS